MSDPSQKKPCKSDATESQSSKKQLTLAKRLTSISISMTSYLSQFATYVRGLFPNKKVSGDDLKELVCETEEKIKQVYEKILKEVKVFQENELQTYKNYSKEELAKAETKFREYSSRMKDILGELIKRLEYLKNGLKTKIITHKEFQSFVTYFEEKIDETKKLTQDMIKNIHETIKDPELKRKLVAIVETNYKKIRSSMDTLYTGVKEANTVEENKCRKLELSDQRKSFKSTAMSYINRVMTYASGLVSRKRGQTETPISPDVKSLFIVTEVKIKEFYDEILKKVKDLSENELQTYTNYSKDELSKVKYNLQEYSVKVWKLSEDMLKHLKALKNQLQTRIITHEDFQSLVSYFEDKITETKKLTEDIIKNIQTTIKEPVLGKKLETMVETNSKKIKIALDDLYTAVKKNVQLKSLSDKKSLFSKMPTFGKMKTSMECSSAQTLPSNGNEAATADCKGDSTVGLHKEKLPFFNLSKHFNSKTIHGRANVAKATYAGILIYYIYRKTKSTTT